MKTYCLKSGLTVEIGQAITEDMIVGDPPKSTDTKGVLTSNLKPIVW